MALKIQQVERTESEEQKELDQVRGATEALTNEIIALGSTKKNIEEVIQVLKNQERDAIKASETVQLDIQVKTNRLKEDTEDAEQVLKGVNEAIVSLKSRESVLVAALASLEGKKETLKEAILALEIVITKQEIKHNGVVEQNEQEKEILLGIKKEQSELKAGLAQFDLVIAGKNKEIELKQAELTALDTEINRSTDVITHQKGVRRDLDEGIFILKASYTRLERVNKEQTDILDVLSEDIQKVKTDTANRTHLLNLTEQRVADKVILLKKMIEKAQSDKLIGDFII